MPKPSVENPITPRDAKRMYRRVLASWAQDLMVLRATGMDRPGRMGNDGRARAADAAGIGLYGGSAAWSAGRAA